VENAAKLARAALELPIQVGAALLASAEGYTPRSTKVLEEAREKLGSIQDVALALSENLPAPKPQASRSRRRRRRKRKPAVAGGNGSDQVATGELVADSETPRPKRRRRRRKPAGSAQEAVETPSQTDEPADAPDGE
jgi:hypothetical protein